MTKVSTLSTSLYHCARYSSQYNQARKRRYIQIGKEEVKLSLFVDGIILCVENSKESTKTIANTWVQQGCKIHDQCTKSVVFPYTSNKETKSNHTEHILFTIAPKQIKYLNVPFIKGSARLVHWKLQNIANKN